MRQKLRAAKSGKDEATARVCSAIRSADEGEGEGEEEKV